MINIGVLVSGSGTNLLAIIEAIKKGRIDGVIRIVISDKPHAYALRRARFYNIKTNSIDPEGFNNREEYDREIVSILKEKEVDLVVLAGYMKMLTPYFINAYKNKIMNIHPALLPSFPGLHVQKKAIDHGVKVSGCTVHFVDEGLDSGPIILQKAVKVKEDDTEESLTKRILKEEHEIYPRAIQLFAQDRLSINGRKVLIKERQY
ncbi:MAG: phosphoribosylglycinamide formyltransferase [Candidatus Caldatribacteriota bacterium]|nr:phosphoribosylglycinamide formyltransferase [Candidatus Caldatribacteriota bacterium]